MKDFFVVTYNFFGKLVWSYVDYASFNQRRSFCRDTKDSRQLSVLSFIDILSRNTLPFRRTHGTKMNFILDFFCDLIFSIILSELRLELFEFLYLFKLNLGYFLLSSAGC
jgi:hypothetical protein